MATFTLLMNKQVAESCVGCLTAVYPGGHFHTTYGSYHRFLILPGIKLSRNFFIITYFDCNCCWDVSWIYQMFN